MTIFIKLTCTLALIGFAMMAFSSCQQAGRNYNKGFSNGSYQSFETIKPYSEKDSSSTPGS
jgi:hypothetical protein